MANERIIRVTGKGVLKVKPDRTRITMTLEGQNKEYDKILEQSSKDTEVLNLGFFLKGGNSVGELINNRKILSATKNQIRKHT